MAEVVVIPPTGAIEVVEKSDPLAFARRYLAAGVDIVSAPDRRHVLAVDGCGAGRLPQNPRGWACYGRSMLYGAVVLWADDGGRVDPDLVQMVRSLPDHVDVDAIEAEPDCVVLPRGGAVTGVLLDAAKAYWSVRV